MGDIKNISRGNIAAWALGSKSCDKAVIGNYKLCDKVADRETLKTKDNQEGKIQDQARCQGQWMKGTKIKWMSAEVLNHCLEACEELDGNGEA